MRAHYNGLPIHDNVKTITYHRKPTVSEIKFGYGAMHYRDFDIEELVKPDGNIKKWIKAKDDGLRYYDY
jgi:hypothetical protein